MPNWIDRLRQMTGVGRLEEQAKAATETATGGLNPVEVLDMETRVVEALRSIYDPEIPVDIFELGLVYNLKVDPSGDVTVQMTLTAPSCPEAASIPARVESKVRAISGVRDVKVELVWEPPWSPARMSEAAKLSLGFL